MRFHTFQPLLALVAFSNSACNDRDDTKLCADRLASAQRGNAAVVLDSVAAVSLLRCAILVFEPDEDIATLHVEAFVADSTGFHITLVPDKRLNVAGGGGRARITLTGVVRDLELFQ